MALTVLGDTIADADVDGLVSLLDTPAAIVDPNGEILFCNEAFDTNFALPGEMLLGANVLDQVDSASAISFKIFMASAGRARRGQKLSLTWGGTTRWTRLPLTLKPIRRAGGPELFLLQAPHQQNPTDAKLRFFVEQLDHGVWEYDTRADSFTVSPRWRHIRGLNPTEPMDTANGRWLQDIHEEDRQRLRAAFEGQRRGEAKNIRIEYRYRHKAGHYIWLLSRGSIIEVDNAGKPLRIVGTDTDITDIKRKEEELSQLTYKMQLAMEASGIGIWEYDPQTDTETWDERMLEMYELTPEEVAKHHKVWEVYLHPEDKQDIIAYAADCLDRNADFKADYRILTGNGSVRHVRSIARASQSQETFGTLVGVNIDVTEDYSRAEELEQARRQLEYDSRHDALTGLANRRLLDETVDALLADMSNDGALAVMHIDLDHFKVINDTMGHAAGDAVLVRCAERMRRTIPPEALICRLGGDEFAVLFPDAPPTEDLRRIGEDIVDVLQKPVAHEGRMCQTGGSVGIARSAGRPERMSEIFVNADVALYAAKTSGRGRVDVFCQTSHKDHNHLQRRVHEDLIAAIDAGEIVCYFQPQYDAKTLAMNGAEALVRWNCAGRGLLTPDRFLPMTDEAGLTPLLDECVLDYVLACQDRWHDAGMAYPPVSLNVSQDRLLDPGFPEQFTSRVRPHHALRLELLETAFLDVCNSAMGDTLAALRDLGIELELDDFGSGHASVLAMQQVRPSRVKIDRALIDPVTRSPQQVVLLQKLIELARIEGVGTVLEGVETAAHLSLLRELPSEALQGYALSHPMPAQSFEEILMSQRTAIAD